jgi:hypothetical protein
LGRISGTNVGFGLGLGSAFEDLDRKMSQPNARRDDTLEECDQAFYQLKGLAKSALRPATAPSYKLLTFAYFFEAF